MKVSINLKDKIEKLHKTGFFSVFIASILSKVVTLLGGVILVRVLSKNDYGTYSYINNCVSMLFLFGDFGISSATLQYLTENIEDRNKQNSFLKFSIFLSVISSLIIGIIFMISPLFYPYVINEARRLVPMLCLIPLISTFNGLFSIVLRANFKNNKYSVLQILTTVITYLFLIPFSWIWGVHGAVFSQYAYGSIILIISIIFIKKYLVRGEKSKKYKLDAQEKKGFIKFAFAFQLNNTISSLLIHIDMFLIGIMVVNMEQIATYNVGSKLPYALTFLATCVSIYIGPHFVKNNKNKKWLNDNLNVILKYGALGFGMMCILLVVLVKPIFTILFGSNYYDAIPIYIVLIIGLFFTSAFKVPCGNIMAALRKIKINIYVNILSLVFNFITNIIFIKFLGVIGAAITTTVTNIIISIFYTVYLKMYLKKCDDNLS